MGQRIILTENEKLNIRKMYGMINETSETGCISGNCENGVGTWVYPTDDNRFKYVGKWENGERVYGTSYWKNGDFYEGAFKDDKRGGKGVFHWSDGYSYVGEFKDGKRHGRGKMMDKDGKITQDGYWKDDVFQGKFRSDCTENFKDKYPNSFTLELNNIAYFKADKQKHPHGDYYCTDENTINLTHFNYDPTWDYRLTLDTSGVKKVLTRKKSSDKWIDVTTDVKKKEAKDAILKDVFKITE